MNGRLKKLKDSNGNYAYPITVGDAVYVSENKTLTQKLTEIGTPTNNELSGLTWNALGDSITAIQGDVIKYHTVISNNYGIIVNNYATSGRCIAGATGFAVNYTSMTNNADIITILGGFNDHLNQIPIGTLGDTTVDTYYGALDVLLKGLLVKYKGKRIGFLIPFIYRDYGRANYIQYVDVAIEMCKKYSMPYLDLHRESTINCKEITSFATDFYMNADQVHPNTEGHAILARKIYAFLKTL